MICVVEQIESKACINHCEGRVNCYGFSSLWTDKPVMKYLVLWYVNAKGWNNGTEAGWRDNQRQREQKQAGSVECTALTLLKEHCCSFLPSSAGTLGLYLDQMAKASNVQMETTPFWKEEKGNRKGKEEMYLCAL